MHFSWQDVDGVRVRAVLISCEFPCFLFLCVIRFLSFFLHFLGQDVDGGRVRAAGAGRRAKTRQRRLARPKGRPDPFGRYPGDGAPWPYPTIHSQVRDLRGPGNQ